MQVVAVVTGLQLDAMMEAESVIKNFGARIKVVSPAATPLLVAPWGDLP